MAHERDASLDTVPSLLAAEDGFSAEDIRRSLAGPREQRRQLATWLLDVVDREVRITLRPIALRYRRNLCDAAEDFIQDVLVLLLHDDGRVLRTWDPARGMKLRSFISLVVRRYLCRRLRGFRGNPWSIDPTDAEELAAYLEGGTTTGAQSFTHTEYHRYLDEVLRILHGELNERDWRIFVKLYVKHETPGEVGADEEMRENTVHKVKSRIQQRIRQIFAPTQPSARIRG
jgi:RNA polymerase sigma factor (sigma-70 family)